MEAPQMTPSRVEFWRSTRLRLRRAREWAQIRSRKAPSHTIDFLDRPWSLFGTVVILFLAALLPWGLPNWLALTSYSIVWILTALAGSAVALLAVVYAIGIFRAQFLATRLPPEMVGALFFSRSHRSALIRLVAIAVTSWIALAPVSQDHLPAASSSVVILGVILLFATLFGIYQKGLRPFSRDYSRIVVSALNRYLRDSNAVVVARGRGRLPPGLQDGTASSVDAFGMIEQVCVRSLKEGDITTAHHVLRSNVEMTLDRTQKDPAAARAFLGWVGGLLSLIGRKALAINEERTSEFALLLFENLFIMTLERKLPWSDRIELLEAFQDLAGAAVRAGKPQVASRSLHVLHHAFESAVRVCPGEENLPSLRGDWGNRTPEQQTAELEWDRLDDDWIGPMSSIVDAAIAEGLRDVVFTGQFVLGMGGYDLPKSTHLGDEQKRRLLRRMIWTAKANANTAVDSGRDQSFVIWPHGLFPRNLIEGGFPEAAKTALLALSDVMISAAQQSRLPWMLLNELAAEGRGMANDQQDEFAVLLIETLGALAAPLAGSGSAEMSERYLEAVSALRSLSEWDKRPESEIKSAVEVELRRFEAEKDTLEKWRQERPSRRQQPSDKPHASPWA